jgi:hypothetical protein
VHGEYSCLLSQAKSSANSSKFYKLQLVELFGMRHLPPRPEVQ